jgi:thiol-disulfide isomerase/thioredoxin
MRSTALPALAAAALALTLAACGTSTSGDPATGSPTASSSAASPAPSDAGTGTEGSATSDASAPGAYVTLADYEKDPAAHAGTKVVYFFHASWCPSCRATEAAIGDAGIPDGLTVVKVDFDDATELRQRYGVTQQHTFVQVDDSGAELAKWTGSEDGAAILGSTV